MSDTLGRNIRVHIFGESHQKLVGITIEGLPAGIHIDEEFMGKMLERRKSSSDLTTPRHEEDRPVFISGLFDGCTCGTPLTILFENNDVRSADYEKAVLRPSQVDYVAYKKYYEHQDYRGSGHFSSRLTVCLVAAGAICMQILNRKGIYIGTHVKECGSFRDQKINKDEIVNELLKLNGKKIPVLNDEKELVEMIKAVRDQKDSIGARMETIVHGLPAGIGDPYFDSLESVLSHGLFSIPAVKGVSFGLGFDYSGKKGSEVNDSWHYNNDIYTTTNNDGGINGGISNGMPLVINSVFKPTASIGRKQKTINYETRENIEYELKGRHDPAVFIRGAVVIDSVCAMVLLDSLVSEYGKRWASEE